jgi:uncharacterized protein (DUF1800 family)
MPPYLLQCNKLERKTEGVESELDNFIKFDEICNVYYGTSQTLHIPQGKKSMLNRMHLGQIVFICALLSACGGAERAGQVNLVGQVNLAAAQPSVTTFYAASRLLEQAAMGPSPTSVAQVRKVGIEAWIEAQQKLAPSVITTPANLIEYDLNQDKVTNDLANRTYQFNLQNIFIASEDQLRIRTSWVLSNFLVVSTQKIQPYGGAEYLNTLQRNAFSNYSDLLRAVTLSPAMGFFLDNGQNNKWNLNENYGRELMQLFSVGLVQLNMDGSIKRDANGKALETYTQADVIASTKALTGWHYVTPNCGSTIMNCSNGFNYGKPMVANQDAHNTEAKQLFGKTIAAGQSAEKDLESLIDILVNHPNTAPFVALRLIQGFTTSDPSPAYISRVATVFQSTKGDLKAVVKAVLMDPEARAGDVPGKSPAGFGRIKDPHLVNTSLLRALECAKAGTLTNIFNAWTQSPLNAKSVFNFYPPNHRAPSSKLLAPEQQMLTSEEFNMRLGHVSGAFWAPQVVVFMEAGCNLDLFKTAASASDGEVLNLISQRFFRGAMPAATGQALVQSANETNNPLVRAGQMIDMALITPAFGVSK